MKNQNYVKTFKKVGALFANRDKTPVTETVGSPTSPSTTEPAVVTESDMLVSAST